MIYVMIGCLILFGIISIDMIRNSRDTFERNVGVVGIILTIILVIIMVITTTQT